MSILADWEIAALCLPWDEVKDHVPERERYHRIGDEPMLFMRDNPPMISPFDPGEKKPGRISSGLSSYGYDLRLANKFKVFTNMHGGVVDPKRADPRHLFDSESDVIEVPPNSYVLAHSVETFHMPDNVTAIVLGKSSYARVGVLVNCTPIEAGWRGTLTLEIANLGPLPVRLYANEGAAQVVFFRGHACGRPYGTRSGTYNDQTGITLARVAT